MPRLLCCMVLLALGLTTTVTVAWTCSAGLNPGVAGAVFSQEEIEPKLWELLTRRSRFGHTRIDRLTGQMQFSEDREQLISGALSIGGGSVMITTTVASSPGRSEATAGWPLHALTCFNSSAVNIDSGGMTIGIANSGGTIIGGIELPPFTTGGSGPRWRALPYQPIWSGLIVDTMAFALLWWVAFLAAIYGRRAIRRKRGLCAICGYDLRGAAHERCPECGQVIHASVWAICAQAVGNRASDTKTR